MWNYFFPRCFLYPRRRTSRKKHTFFVFFVCRSLSKNSMFFLSLLLLSLLLTTFDIFQSNCLIQLQFGSVRFGFESSFSTQHFIHALSSLFIIIYLFSLVEFFSLSFSCVRSLYAFCRLFGSFSYSVSAIRLGESESVDGKKWMCFLFFFQCVKL